MRASKEPAGSNGSVSTSTAPQNLFEPVFARGASASVAVIRSGQACGRVAERRANAWFHRRIMIVGRQRGRGGIVSMLLRRVWGSDLRRNRIDVQIFLREHQKVLDLVSIVLYIPPRCARRKKTSQLRGSGDVKQISVAVKGGFSQGETPDVAGARCDALPEKGTRRFSIRKMSSVVAGGDAQASFRVAA